VWPGDTLDASAKVTALANRDGIHFAEFEVTTVNQNGVQVLSGYAEARIDP
jgi:acyl dehydratase